MFQLQPELYKDQIILKFSEIQTSPKIWGWKITTKQDDILFTSMKLNSVSTPVSSCNASKTFG